jgi:protein involved in polysaccharide export with SLBB domain
VKRPGGGANSGGGVPILLAFLLALALAVPASAQTFDQQEGDTERIEELERSRREEMNRRLVGATQAAMRLPGAVVPAAYRIGAGDLLQLTLWGGVTRTIPIEVTPEGSVLLPTAGPMMVDGKTLRDVREQILKRLRPEFRGVNIDVQLVRPRQFLVYVTGQVEVPGTAAANGASRVGDLVMNTEPLEDASLRNIEVVHRDGTREVADLELFLRTASQSLNPWLRDGDVINVPPATRCTSSVRWLAPHGSNSALTTVCVPCWRWRVASCPRPTPRARCSCAGWITRAPSRCGSRCPT